MAKLRKNADQAQANLDAAKKEQAQAKKNRKKYFCILMQIFAS